MEYNKLNPSKMKTIKPLLIATLFLSIFSISCEKAADANFTYSQTGTGTVNFTNTSSHADSYNWNFGDGTNSTEASPSHTYNSVGNYSVTLKADGPGGDGTNTQNIIVY
jgi:PKD repeat protein